MISPRLRLYIGLIWILPVLLAGCGDQALQVPQDVATKSGDFRATAVGVDPLDSLHVLIEAPDITPQELGDLGAVQILDLSELGVKLVVSQDGIPASEFSLLLAQSPKVLNAEPDRRAEAPESRGMTVSFDDGFTVDDYQDQTFFTRLRVAPAHNLAKGKNTLVAIIDTGIDPTHPELASRYTGGFDLIDMDSQPLETADGIDDDEDGLTDEAYGHGTHVAGLVALLAPEAQIRSYRVLNSEGWGDASLVAAAIVRAVLDGADVINLSLGMYSPVRAIELALDFAETDGVLVVSSAGNDGIDTPPQYPAYYENVIAVGSVDEEDLLSGFSNYGSHLFVTAPGEGIRSTAPGGGYAGWSGTSMAAPMVSALVAVLHSHSPSISPAGLTNRISAGTAPGTGTPGVSGWGRIDYRSSIRTRGEPGRVSDLPARTP